VLTSHHCGGWRPAFLDYLYVSFTNASAFSPTNAMPLSVRIKSLMRLRPPDCTPGAAVRAGTPPAGEIMQAQTPSVSGVTPSDCFLAHIQVGDRSRVMVDRPRASPHAKEEAKASAVAFCSAFGEWCFSIVYNPRDRTASTDREDWNRWQPFCWHAGVAGV